METMSAVFQQVRGIGVAQGVHRDVFLDAAPWLPAVQPLHPALGVATVKITAFPLELNAVEQERLGFSASR